MSLRLAPVLVGIALVGMFLISGTGLGAGLGRPSGGGAASIVLSGTSVATSTHWAGWVVSSAVIHGISGVRGSWVQPHMGPRCAPLHSVAGAAFGIGEDGWSSSGAYFEFVGTIVTCHGGPAPRTNITAIAEVAPFAKVRLSLAIHEGDVVSAGIAYSHGHQHLWITDHNTSITREFVAGGSVSKSLPRSTAEWIASSVPGMAALARFGSVEFGRVYSGVPSTGAVELSGHWHSIAGTPGHLAVWIFSPSNQVVARSTGLVGEGTSFSVLWKHY